jgi:hypothetical protein
MTELTLNQGGYLQVIAIDLGDHIAISGPDGLSVRVRGEDREQLAQWLMAQEPPTPKRRARQPVPDLDPDPDVDDDEMSGG